MLFRSIEIFRELPLHSAASRGLLEMKIVGLVGIYGYAFFKFGWSYRLFNYAAILIGAVPTPRSASPEDIEAAVVRAGEMQIDAGHHFHRGLRAMFFSVGFFGWFVDARVFLVSTTVVLVVLLRRQFLSRARAAVFGALPPTFLTDVDQGPGQIDEDRPVNL